MAQVSDTAAWLTAVRRSNDRLAGLVGGMDAGDLGRPSACSEWTVAQVLSHLGSQAEIFGLLLDAGLSGGDPPSPEVFGPIWDSWNGRSTLDQARDSVGADEALVSRLESLDPETLEGFRLHMFGRQLDAAGLLRMRLAEHAVHTWDVAVASDPAAQVAGDAVELLVDGLGEVAARSGRPPHEPLDVVVTTTAPARRFLLSAAESVRLEATDDGDHREHALELPGEAFLRLVYGRLGDKHPPQGPVHAVGVSIEDLHHIFEGI